MTQDMISTATMRAIWCSPVGFRCFGSRALSRRSHRRDRSRGRRERGRKRAQPGLREVERARLALVAFAGRPRGKVAVGVTPTVNMMLAASLVPHCREEFPKVSLSLVGGMGETLMEWVENDRLDMAFSYN